MPMDTQPSSRRKAAEPDRRSQGNHAQPAPTSASVRRGLLEWLRQQLDAPRLRYLIPPSTMPGGTETGTSTWRFRLTGAPAGLDGALVLRLYAFAQGTGRAVRESRVQAALARTAYPVPEVYFTCTDRFVLGGAFFVMRFVPGEILAHAPTSISGMLCRAHLALHRIDPAPVMTALRQAGVPVAPSLPADDLTRMAQRARNFPGLMPIVDWMSKRIPPDPERISICHGDFHPLNIVVRDDELAGVLDWPNFMLADPAADVGSTMTLGIPARHLFSPGPIPRLWDRYLECYRRKAHIDSATLDYYRTRRCLSALLAGAGGRKIWRHPAILRDLIGDLRERTGVALATPPWSP